MSEETKFFIHGEQRKEYPLFAADGVEITPEMLGRSVEFKSYEDGKPVQGIGTLVGIDFQFKSVYVKIKTPIIIYSKFGSRKTDTIQISSSYQFKEPSGCYVHRKDTCWRFDYPEDASIIFRFVNEGGAA